MLLLPCLYNLACLVPCAPVEYDSNSARSAFSVYIELCCPPVFVSSIKLELVRLNKVHLGAGIERKQCSSHVDLSEYVAALL